jgi:hypothetical protein
VGGTRLVDGSSSYTTTDVFNGRMWKLLNGAQKISHLTGIHEGIILCLNQIKEDLRVSSDLMKEMQDSGIFDRRRLLFTYQGITEIEARMDRFYEDYANLDIPVIAAYQHITLELNFATAEDIKNNLLRLRRKY